MRIYVVSAAKPMRTAALGASAALLTAVTAFTGATAATATTGTAAAVTATIIPRTAHTTVITLDGRRPGPAYQGIGAISGGGGNSRLLVDYPAAQRRQILDYLFKPGYGAALQILKLEIGGDVNSSDGSEPSVEHAQGQVNCAAGYEFWLAEQARALNPAIKIYGLQWAAPGWVGGGHQTVWTRADIRYVLDWLNCARSHGLTVNYVGGWNERGDGFAVGGPAWFEGLRAALNTAGYRSVRIVAADSFVSSHGPDVANDLAADPAFLAAVAVIGYHDSCGYPTSGSTCTVPAVARKLGKPVWQSEIGAMDSNLGAAAMARSINNSYLQAGVTALIHWPVVDSMPPYLPYENRGLVWADQPWSGHYQVNLMTWVIAQTTQFARPGWRHITGANAALGRGSWGTYDSYEAPHGSAWSLVVQTTTAHAAQSVVVRLKGGLARSAVRVWSTSLNPRRPGTWFVRDADAHPVGGTFRYVIRPGYVYTFSTSVGQGKGRATAPASASMPLPYTARPDSSNEAWALAAQDGAFEYARDRQTIVQTADVTPVFWHVSGPRFPYAVVGGGNWSDYTVFAKVRFSATGQTAGLIARFDRSARGTQPSQFAGYRLVVSASGAWRLIHDRGTRVPVTLRSGTVSAPGLGTWAALALAVHGTKLIARIDSTRVASVTLNAAWLASSPEAGTAWTSGHSR